MLRFAILVTGEPDQDVIQKKGTFTEMFLALLKDSGNEEWKSFLAYQGEFPTDDQLEQVHGLVITGSVGDAFGSDSWLVELRKCIRKAVSMKKRVLGVCFGHQVVGTAFGAKVGRAGYFECGARALQVNLDVQAKMNEPWARFLSNNLVVHECHQDQVLEVPEGATILASSARCPIEVYSIGSNVLCFQGHPEFDSEVVVMLTDNRRDMISPEDLRLRDDSYAQLRPEQHSLELQQLCKVFLKG